VELEHLRPPDTDTHGIYLPVSADIHDSEKSSPTEVAGSFEEVRVMETLTVQHAEMIQG
jgi:hypothetical protein